MAPPHLSSRRSAAKLRECRDRFPQGGGNHFTNHSCAGEWPTIALMRPATRLLLGAMRYEVPAQDLGIDPARMPARPGSGFVMTNVRR